MNTTESVNILMVDDQPGKLLTYQAILQDLGENLISATSGERPWNTSSARMLPSF